mmetsp:Transcript_7628/g.19599  ORF Transcript_7628/g.19599 Transcript_7628/m.19599 type:complete len:486 (+) Transcript_7628:959-2416(+)
MRCVILLVLLQPRQLEPQHPRHDRDGQRRLEGPREDGCGVEAHLLLVQLHDARAQVRRARLELEEGHVVVHRGRGAHLERVRHSGPRALAFRHAAQPVHQRRALQRPVVAPQLRVRHEVEGVVRHELVLAAGDAVRVQIVELGLALDVVAHLAVLQRGPGVRLVQLGRERVADVLDGAVLPHGLELVLAVKVVLRAVLQDPQDALQGLAEHHLRPDGVGVRGAGEAEVALLQGLARAPHGVRSPVDLLVSAHRELRFGHNPGSAAVEAHRLEALLHRPALGWLGLGDGADSMAGPKALCPLHPLLLCLRVVVLTAVRILFHHLPLPLALVLLGGAPLGRGRGRGSLCATRLHQRERVSVPVARPQLAGHLGLLDDVLQGFLDRLAVLEPHEGARHVVAQRRRPALGLRGRRGLLGADAGLRDLHVRRDSLGRAALLRLRGQVGRDLGGGGRGLAHLGAHDDAGRRLGGWRGGGGGGADGGQDACA